MTQQTGPASPPYGQPGGPDEKPAPAPPTRVAQLPPLPTPHGQPRSAPPPAPLYAQPQAAPVPGGYAPAQAAPPQIPPQTAPPQGPPPVPPQAAPPQGAPYGQPSFGPAQPYGQPPAAPPAGGYGFPPAPAGPPRKKRTGLIVGIVVGVLVLAGLGVGAIFLFGTKTLDNTSVQSQISSNLKSQIGVTPTNVSCPSGVEAKSGKTFQCTAALEGQPITVAVTETNDNGAFTARVTNNVADVSKIEQQVAQQVSNQIGIDVTASCDVGGKHVLVDSQNKPITCTVTNQSNSSDSAQVTATYDAQYNVSVKFPNS